MRSLLVVATTTIIFVVVALSPSLAFNITTILSKHSDLSTFSHYLTITHLAADINRRKTITVLAVDNAAMSSLIETLHPSLFTLRHILSLHILTDYFAGKKLRRAGATRAASVFQSSGAAPGISGYVNITAHHHGKVTFAAGDAPSTVAGEVAGAVFLKSIKELPYDISVLEISAVLSSPAADTPTPAPAPVNLTDLMVEKGCREFATMVDANADVKAAFEANLDIGLTVFCANDKASKAFAPKFKNLSSTAKTAVLLYHGLPAYYSMQILRSNNGVVETLATTGTTAMKYHYTVKNEGEEVKLETKVDTATIMATLLDADPAAIYRIDKVLEPRELFSAPAPEGMKERKGKNTKEAAGPETVEEAEADESGAVSDGGRWWFPVAATGLLVVWIMV